MTVRRSSVLRGASLPLLVFSVTGCMHGFMGMAGQDPQPQSDPVIVRELVGEGIRAMATFPPLVVGKETRISLRVTDASTSRPIQDVVVLPRVSLVEEHSGQSMGQMRRGSVSQSHESHSGPAEGQPIPDAEIGRERGVEGEYLFSFLPSRSGEYWVALDITAVMANGIERKVVLDAVQNATEGMGGHASGSMSGSGSRWILGGIAMGAMMVTMWVWRGG